MNSAATTEGLRRLIARGKIIICAHSHRLRRKEIVTKIMRIVRSIVGIGAGLILGALAGIILGALVGVGLAIAFGVI